MATSIQRYRVGDQPVPGYALRKFLGRGGMGEVWMAESPGGVAVAMKILYDLQDRGGRKEFRALQRVKRVRHPNITPILAFWIKDENGNLIDDTNQFVPVAPAAPENPQRPPAVSMTETLDISSFETDNEEQRQEPDEPSGAVSFEDVQARQLILAMGLGDKSLSDRLSECLQENLPGIPADELLRYMKAAADAIDLLNIQYGIQHCDIKPQNILVVGGGVQVCDFGLAQEVANLERTTAQAVTFPYAPPELLDEAEPSKSTDQYELAITYAQLRTGQLPYEKETISAIVHAKSTGHFSLSRLKPEVRRVVTRALAANPENRYPSCRDFVDALEEAEFPKPKASGSWRRLAAMAMLMVALFGGGGVLSVLLGVFPENGQFDLPKLRKSFEGSLEQRDFLTASLLLRGLRSAELRTEFEGLLLEKWQEYDESSNSPLPLNRDQYDAIVSAVSSDSPALAFRSEVLDRWLQDAESLMTADRFDEAKEHLAGVLKHIEASGQEVGAEAREQLARQNTEFRLRATLDYARVLARDAKERERLSGLLKQLAGLESRANPDQRALLVALQAIHNAHEANFQDQAIVRQLATWLDALKQSNAALPSWETEQIQLVQDNLLRGAVRDRVKEYPEDVQQIFTRIWPHLEIEQRLFDLRDALVKATETPWPLASDTVAGYRAQLEQIRGMQPSSELAWQVEDLAAWINLLDSQTPEAQALAGLRERAGSQRPQNLSAIASAVAWRGWSRDSLESAVALVREYRDQLSTTARPQLNAPLAQLLTRKIEEGVFGTAPDYATLLADCDSLRTLVGNDHNLPPAVRLCRAECLLEQAGPAQTAQPATVRGLLGIDLTDQPRSIQAYHAYLSGLVSELTPSLAVQARETIYRAASEHDPEHESVFRSEHRRARAAGMLVAAAREMPDRNVTFGRRVLGGKEAEIIRYFEAAERLDPEKIAGETSELLAMAYTYRGSPEDLQKAESCWARVPAEGQSELAALVARGQYHARQNQWAPAATYLARALDQLNYDRREVEALEEAQAGQLVQEIVLPAMQAAEQLKPNQLDARSQQALARAFAIRGALLVSGREGLRPLLLPNPNQGEAIRPEVLAYESFRRAVELNAANADYWIGAGELAVDLHDSKLQTLTALPGTSASDPVDIADYAAITAMERGPEELGAKVLKSRVNFRKWELAYKRDDLGQMARLIDEVRTLLEDVQASNQPAITTDRYYGDGLALLADANVRHAFRVADPEQKRVYLQAAIALGEKAVSNSPPPTRLDLAYVSLGNAYEDLAFHVGESSHYPMAADQFYNGYLAAKSTLRQCPRALVSLGRVRYRWATKGGGDRETLFEQGLANLQDARQEDKSPLLHEEALWYEGLIHEARGEYAAASEAFQQAAVIYRDSQLPQWIERQIHSADAALLAQQTDRAQQLAAEGLEALQALPPDQLRQQAKLVPDAVAIQVLTAKSFDQKIQAVEEAVNRFSAPNPAAKLVRLELLVIHTQMRGNPNLQVGRAPAEIMRYWSSKRSECQRDLETCRQLIAELSGQGVLAGPERQLAEARVIALQGEIAFADAFFAAGASEKKRFAQEGIEPLVRALQMTQESPTATTWLWRIKAAALYHWLGQSQYSSQVLDPLRQDSQGVFSGRDARLGGANFQTLYSQLLAIPKAPQ